MASYIDRILGPGERVTYVGRTTNWVYAVPVLITVPILAVGALLTSLAVILFGVFIGLILFIFPFIQQKTTELAVTDRRVIAKFGLISRRTTEMRMSKIESIGIEQSLWARIGGFGTVLIHGTGGAVSPIPQVKDPLGFKRAVEEQLVAYEDAGRAAPGST